MKTAASDVLVALARSHFHFVMAELQSHLKATGKAPDEMVLLTLGKMACKYALQCIPFVGMTLLSLCAMLSQVGSGQTLRVICSVLEQWSKAVIMYICKQKQCTFPRTVEVQLCDHIYPVFCYTVVNWLGCRKEEDKEAVLRAVTAMMEVLLHEGQYGEYALELVLGLLHQYREVRDTSQVTKARSCAGRYVAAGVALCKTLGDALPCHGHALPVLSSQRHVSAGADCDLFPAAIICPEEPVAHLHSQESGGSEASCVAALGLLAALSHSDAPAAREKLPQVVEAVQSICDDSSAQVQRAVLVFIKELLSSGSQICWAWDVVGHIFDEFSRTSGRLVAGSLFAWQTPEDAALQALCVEILGSLDVSLGGVTKLLWPKLLQYVVPAQYSGMLIPISKCLQALAERWERVGCKEEESDAVDSQEHGRSCWARLGASRLGVVAAASHKSSDQAVAALELLQALSGRIHRALGAVWMTKIPVLLQYLEGKGWVDEEGEEGGGR
ncbi:MRO2B protein, partial [Atlantisia rogersi]|nr:MRO2B protein [Atlantisia rogersi]